MKRYITILVILTLALSACSRGNREAKIAEHLTKKLDLTTEQQAILKESLNEITTLMADSKDKTIEVREIIKNSLLQDTFDVKAISSKIQAQIDELSQDIPNYASSIAKFHSSLNDEQKKELSSLVEKYSKHGYNDYKKRKMMDDKMMDDKMMDDKMMDDKMMDDKMMDDKMMDDKMMDDKMMDDKMEKK